MQRRSRECSIDPPSIDLGVAPPHVSAAVTGPKMKDVLLLRDGNMARWINVRVLPLCAERSRACGRLLATVEPAVP